MKKTITKLSACMVVASNAMAIPFEPADNAVVFFNTVGQGSYIMDTGVSADALVNGASFSVNISAATVALGGTIESFGLVGRSIGSGTSIYNYSEFLYMTPDAGVLYAQSTPAPLNTNNVLLQWGFALKSIFDSNNALSFGHQIEGSYGDLDNSGYIVQFNGGLLNPLPLNHASTTSLFHQYHQNSTTSFETAQDNISGGYALTEAFLAMCPLGLAEDPNNGDCPSFYAPLLETGFFLEGNTFGFKGTLVPIPATAWLFMSATAALMGVKLKKKWLG